MRKIKLFEEFVETITEKKGDSYSYGCVMLYFDFPQMNEIHEKIEEGDLYTEEEDRTYGLEDEPHCTLLYGLHDDVTLDQIKEVVNEFDYTNLILHNASLFENQYDVLKFDVGYSKEEDKFLHECNEALTKLPHTNDFPDYHPHATIAYIKKGLGEKYTEKLKDQEYTVKPSHIVYSEANGTKTKIKI
jgi:2'-5' RNA ligase